jgi:hypothetical protein
MLAAFSCSVMLSAQATIDRTICVEGERIVSVQPGRP